MTVNHLEVSECRVSVDGKHFGFGSKTDAKDMYIILSDMLREMLLLKKENEQSKKRIERLEYDLEHKQNHLNQLLKKPLFTDILPQAMEIIEINTELEKENEHLKQLIKELEEQIHLVHMSSMFSTVKSFKGDVSKRYKYSEKTDTIYDTANTYGQYNKVLDKKEVVMLLNEYETLLGSDVE